MNRRKIHEAKVKDTQIQLFDTDKLDDPVLVDGVHAFSLDGNNLRIDLFTVSDDSTGECQRRDVACRVVIPVAQFGHFVKSVNHQAMQFASAAKAKRELDKKSAEAA